MQDKMRVYQDLLRSSGYKLTPQRKLIIDILLENEESHLSAEDIYLLTKEISPELSLATIYRTLEVLTEIKVVRQVNFGDGQMRYELGDDSDLHHHHHLVCVICQRVEEFNEDWLGEIEDKIEREHDFEILDHRLIFQGVCKSCRKINK